MIFYRDFLSFEENSHNKQKEADPTTSHHSREITLQANLKTTKLSQLSMIFVLACQPRKAL